MPPMTTNCTPWRLSDRTMAAASRSGIGAGSLQPQAFALALCCELVGRQQRLGSSKGCDVGVKRGEAHPDLSARSAEQTAEGVDRRRAAPRLVRRHRSLAGARSFGERLLREPGLPPGHPDQVP